jgi:hypothetical protein
MTGIRMSDEDRCSHMTHNGAPCLSDYEESVLAYVLVFDGRITYLSILVRDAIDLVL